MCACVRARVHARVCACVCLYGFEEVMLIFDTGAVVYWKYFPQELGTPLLMMMNSGLTTLQPMRVIRVKLVY